MEMTKWNKLFTRELTEDEKEDYGDRFDFMWDGKMPEIDEEVLVYTSTSGQVTTDTWVDYGDGIGFENTDDDSVIYWMSFPKPPESDEVK